jgi:hypothetical protein
MNVDVGAICGAFFASAVPERYHSTLSDKAGPMRLKPDSGPAFRVSRGPRQTDNNTR